MNFIGAKLEILHGRKISFGENESDGSMPIVFVHLNGKIPKYLKLNIISTIRRFPNNQVVLIINRNLNDYRIDGLSVYKYEEDAKWKILEKLLSHPKDFRDNFWLISLARFFALEQLMLDYRNEFMHVESDVLLSKDFPFNNFSKLKETIAYPVVSRERGVASTLYIKNLEIILSLTNFTIEIAKTDSQTSDMIILRKFYNQFKNQVAVLPFGPAHKECYSEYIETDLLSSIVNGAEYFNGIFDGNDIGVYFFGTNPVNLRGRTILRKPIELNYANMRMWQPTYNTDRNFMDIKIDDKSEPIPVYSIHATVKSNSLFSLNRQDRILRLRIKQSMSKSRTILLPNTFLIQLKNAIKRRMKHFLRRNLV